MQVNILPQCKVGRLTLIVYALKSGYNLIQPDISRNTDHPACRYLVSWQYNKCQGKISSSLYSPGHCTEEE